MTPRVRLQMLGSWELSADERKLPRPATQKTLSLLAYLVMNHYSAHHREKLATLFWPDAEEDNAQRSLRTALWSIRRLLDQGHQALAAALVTTRADVRWAPRIDVELDVQQFEEAILQGANVHAHNPRSAITFWEVGAGLYRGPLLEGLYDDWCLNERYRLEEKFIALLERMVVAQEQAGRFREAVTYGLRVLEIDPLREDMHARVIRLFGLLGDRSAVARQFRRCKDVLESELAVEPGPEVAAALEEARTAEGRRERAPEETEVTPRSVRRPTILGGSIADEASVVAQSGGYAKSGAEPLIGRESQRHALHRRLSAVEAGVGGTLLLVGEAGSGKTVLIQEIAARARWRNVRVLWGRCYEFERVVPYQPFAEALRGGLHAPEPTAVHGELQGGSVGAPDDDVLAALPTVWKQALRMLLPDWADRLHVIAMPASPQTGDEQGRLLEGIGGLLGALAARQPILLIVDDMHWAAPSTLRLFHFLARTVHRQPIMLLGAYRPEDLTPPSLQAASSETPTLSAIQGSLLEEGRLEVVTLEPFDLPETAALTERFLGKPRTAESDSGEVAGAPVAAELADRLQRYTGGNPLYLTAALQTLRDTERSESAQAGAPAILPTFDQGEGWPIPPLIRDLLARRLERASAPARDALRLAAVAGREFDLEVLETLWGKGEEETLRAVDDLLAARFIKESDRRGARDFAFTHHLLQESIYDGLPRHIRTRTHRKVGEVMETVYGPRTVAAELAFHYEQGGLTAKAVQYARAAGDQAAVGYANDDALRWYSKAVALLTMEQDKAATEALPTLAALRFALIGSRVEVLRRIGLPREEESDIEELLALARDLKDERLTIEALLGQAELLTRAGRHVAAEAAAAEAVARAEAMVGLPEPIRLALHARALEREGNVRLARDAYSDAVLVYEQALTEFRDLSGRDDSPADRRNAAAAGEARVLDQLGWLYERLGDYPAARRFHQTALDLCRTQGDPTGEAAALGHVGNVEWFVGQLDAAERNYAAALSLHRRTGYRRGEGTTLRNLGLVCWRRGDLEQALECHLRAMTIFEDLDDPVGILECHHSVGDVYFAAGALDEALRSYRESLDLAQRSGSSHSLAQSLFGSARALRALGRPTEALDDVARARALCEAIGYRRGLAWCDLEAGIAQSFLGNAALAAELMRSAVERFGALGELGLMAATQAELALVELALGNQGEARALSDQATEALHTGAMGLDQTPAIHFTRYRVLSACGDIEGADHALTAFQAAIESQAARLTSADLRASYLDSARAYQAGRGFQRDMTDR